MATQAQLTGSLSINLPVVKTFRCEISPTWSPTFVAGSFPTQNPKDCMSHWWYSPTRTRQRKRYPIGSLLISLQAIEILHRGISPWSPPSTARIFLTQRPKACISRWWDFPLLETATQAATTTPSRLAYNPPLWIFPTWSPSSAVGFIPLEDPSPLMGFSLSETNQSSLLRWWDFPTRRWLWIQLRYWDFSHSEAKSLQILLMGSLSLKNHNTNSPNHSISNQPYQI